MTTRIRACVRAMSGYVPGEQPTDPNVVKLNTNENPYPPSPRVAEALGKIDPDRLRRYPDPACTALRERIADLHGCDRAAVFVGNGSDEVLALCTRAFVEDDGAIGFFVPSYSLYPVLADIRHVATKPVDLAADFAWPFDFAGGSGLPEERQCALFFLTSPNAPTGMLYPMSELRAFAEAFPGVVVLDEAYVDFAREDGMALARELDNVLVARTLSKSFSLAGLRVGYAVGPPPLIDALFKIKDSYNLNAPAQEIALAALSDMAHMRRNAAQIRATRQRVTEELRARGHTVWPSDANFVWTRPAGTDARALFEGLRAHAVYVRHFPGDRTDDCLRITVGTDREIDRLLEVMDLLADRQSA